MNASAGVYLTATMEYLCAEILELSGNYTKQHGISRIDDRYIFQVFEEDEELKSSFRYNYNPDLTMKTIDSEIKHKQFKAEFDKNQPRLFSESPYSTNLLSEETIKKNLEIYLASGNKLNDDYLSGNEDNKNDDGNSEESENVDEYEKEESAYQFSEAEKDEEEDENEEKREDHVSEIIKREDDKEIETSDIRNFFENKRVIEHKEKLLDSNDEAKIDHNHEGQLGERLKMTYNENDLRFDPVAYHDIE